MRRVEVKQVLSMWVLTIGTEQTIDKAYAFNKLIEAIETACLLNMHIDNVSELPVNQYKLEA